MEKVISIYSPIFSSLNKAHGGITPVIRNLSKGLARQGFEINLLIRAQEHNAQDINFCEGNINVIPIESRHRRAANQLLLKHVRSRRPDAFLSAGHSFNRSAAWLKSAAPEQRVIVSIHNNLSSSTADTNILRALLKRRQVRKTYPRADAIICVSHGVREDLISYGNIPFEKTHVIHNPIVDEMCELDSAPADSHPWLSPTQPPIILGVGRLEKQKSFDILIKAFSIVRKSQDCRLIILGEGSLRRELEALIYSLGLDSQISMPGFSQNPRHYMRHAALVALSSDFEGFGNILVESLAVGTPVISTDCPSGPREILDDGRYGFLVPVRDPAALAAGILDTLKNPLAKDSLKQGAERFTIGRIAKNYTDILIPQERPQSAR